MKRIIVFALTVGLTLPLAAQTTTGTTKPTLSPRMGDKTKAAALQMGAWADNAVIYEVNLRQYTPSGSLREFMPHMDRLSQMGVKILWFMPMQPIGKLNRKGSL